MRYDCILFSIIDWRERKIDRYVSYLPKCISIGFLHVAANRNVTSTDNALPEGGASAAGKQWAHHKIPSFLRLHLKKINLPPPPSICSFAFYGN